MPYSFSDDLANAVRNYLSNQGSLSELLMLRSWYANEFDPQARARGLLPPIPGQPQATDQTPVPIEQALPPGVKVADQAGLSRQQRRKLARDIKTGAVKVNGSDPAVRAAVASQTAAPRQTDPAQG